MKTLPSTFRGSMRCLHVSAVDAYTWLWHQAQYDCSCSTAATQHRHRPCSTAMACPLPEMCRHVQDEQRNTAYEGAIQRAVALLRARGDGPLHALDIGAGSGLLSMMAARHVLENSQVEGLVQSGHGMCTLRTMAGSCATQYIRHAFCHSRHCMPHVLSDPQVPKSEHCYSTCNQLQASHHLRLCGATTGLCLSCRSLMA